MSPPLSPPPFTDGAASNLPAYLSNGLIGLRVLDLPLMPGLVVVSGLAGVHPVAQVEAAASAPYPLAGDIRLGEMWLRLTPYGAQFRDQRYDFSCGEVTTRFTYRTDAGCAEVEVLTFCSRSEPTVVLQEVSVRVDRDAPLTLRAMVDPGGVPGDWLERATATPGEPEPVVDGSLWWETLGGIGSVGIAYVTEFAGPEQPQRTRQEWGLDTPLATDYEVDAVAGHVYRLRQIASLVPNVMHSQPHRQAVRLAAAAGNLGFDKLRARNREAWQELWRGRINLVGAERSWQELTDATFYYLNASVHPASPASTSIFGLAQWTNYHYYYGHVMWDVETFSVPPLLLLQPRAARAILDFRSRTLPAARSNAKLHGRDGFQFPWEASMSSGEEAAPGNGKAAWHEDHVSLDVALAFASYAHITGDREFLERNAWPVLHGVAEWVASRVEQTERGYEIRRAMGIAERPEPSDNEAFTNISARAVLLEALDVARVLGRDADAGWQAIADSLHVPHDAARTHIISHDGWRSNESKGATPGPLAGLFPLWYPADRAVARATLERYLRLAPDYIGSPMLSAFYGTWACWAGDRRLALRLLDEGYAQLATGRFLQVLEQRPDVEPDKARAGPFFANMGAYLSGLLYGMPGIRIGPGEPASWPAREVVLPAGWQSIEVERVWVRGRPARLVARHGDERASLLFEGPSAR